MDNINHRAYIRYLSLKGLTPKEIHEDMVVTLGENAPSYSLVKKWDAEFKRGRRPLSEKPSHRHHTRLLPRFMTSSWQTLSWVSPRSASMQSSTTNFICPRCQHVVSQNPFDLILNELGSTCQGEILSFCRQMPTYFFRDV